jgi:uncharacterized protein (DUF58 family)
MTVSEILKKVRRIELKSKGLSSMEFSGSFKTNFKGRGMSFSEVRAYQYGDDVRNIDWNVTARTGDPHVKVFEEEREQTFMLLIDISASSFFGASAQNKNEYIAELAATIAFSAISNNDKVGIIFFSDKIEKYYAPAKGKTQIMRIIRELVQIKPKSKGTDIKLALKYLTQLVRKRCTAFLISDFYDQNYVNALKVASSRHDLIGIHIFDTRETSLPNIGLLPIEDAETGQLKWIDSSSEKVRKLFESDFLEKQKRFLDAFHGLGADTIELNTSHAFESELRLFFKERSTF